MMKRLIFNGYQAEDLGFIVVEGAPETLANENYEVVEIEGRSGSLIINKGTYPDIERTFTITAIDYIEDENIEEMMNNIKKWFFNVTDNRLYYAFSNKYHIVKKVIFDEDVRTSFEQFGDFQVTFLCEPFYYEDEPTLTYMPGNTYRYVNDGDFESYPKIIFHGMGTMEIIVNGESTKVNNVQSLLQLDSQLLVCVDGDLHNRNKDLIGDYPVFKIGENIIQVPSGQGITQIVITPRTTFR